ncbi:MAG TPA: cyclic nucleotide-binding domain-containing protein [Candidatus Limnocylindria bacterium]|nr:cyclic nucleotide-binding domain-containing protein [Candidatus Limnocylindria bacterium]
MARDQKLDLLRSVPLFAGLDDADIRRLGELVDEVDLPAGRVLMTQGEHGSELVIVIDGMASVVRDGQTLDDCGPGSILGEISLLDGGPRTATVTLTEPSRLLILGRRAFHSLMDEFPEVRLRILETVAHRVRTLEPSAIH